MASDKTSSPNKNSLIWLNGLSLLVHSKGPSSVSGSKHLLSSNIDPTEVIVFLPALRGKTMVFYCIKGDGQAGMSGTQEDKKKLLPSHRTTWKRGSLARMMKTIRFNDKDAICHHWGGKILGPEPITHTAKLKKTRPKSSPLNWN